MIKTTGMKIMHGELTMYQPLPINKLDYADPFLLLHHHGPMTFEPDNAGLPFGPHPHRGFDTVTFIYEGNVVHHDSRGHKSTIEKGGVQWMSAARGIVHSENTSRDFQDAGGAFEIIQLWVNLPSSLKMSEAKYQGIQKDEIPEIIENDGKVKVQIVSGNWNGTKGPANSKTGIIAANIYMKAGGKIELPHFANHKAILYQRAGKASLNGESIIDRQMLYFESEEKMILEAQEDAAVLLCLGASINEPMTSQGPFVMNTKSEIIEAMRDYQMGKMGVLKD